MASEEGCMTITWKIKKCGLLLKENFNLHSNALKIKETEGSSWFKLRANNLAVRDSIQISIHGLKGSSFPAHRCEMSFVSSCGEIPLKGSYIGSLYVSLQKNVLCDETGRSNLPNDTLTLRCRMRERNIKTSELHISSVLSSLSYLWNIKDVSLSLSFNTRIEQGGIVFDVCLVKEDGKLNSWRVSVRKVHCVKDCIPSVVSFSIKDGHGIVKDIPPHVNELLRKDNQFDTFWFGSIEIMPNTQNITLELESIVACHINSPTEIPGHENVSGTGSVAKQHRGCQTEEQLALHSPTRILGHENVSCALGRDFLHLYREGVLSDVTLHAEDPPRSFPAHQTVLAARSPVFRAMFEEESGGGRSVDMAGVDSDTMDRMLVYLYGHSLGDLGWGEASALYRAADKYGVAGLKEECADVLVAGLTPDNACDALVLADGRSGEALMERVVLFILDHEEVVSSAQWDELEKDNPGLAAKITRGLFLRKGKRRRVV